MSFGGPFLGIMAVKQALMRKMPGRIVGEAFDQGMKNDGQSPRRGFVLTLAAREQHIRREKAVSNICSNEGLSMLKAAIYLSLMGKSGLRKVAELCYQKAHYAASELAKISGCTIAGKSPFFKEFVLQLPASLDSETLSEKLFDKGIVAGLPLSRYYPERKHELLVAVTEMCSKKDIDALAGAIREEI
jgi:glycine dehydrogenase subunit 1